MIVLADSGPLIAATNTRDRAHKLAAALVTELGRSLLVPEPVVVEVDHLLRRRVGAGSARAFLETLSTGGHAVHFSSRGLLRRATAIEAEYADLGLGYVDAVVMALAERDGLPILTFDFRDFRATRPRDGFWRLVVDEERYAQATE